MCHCVYNSTPLLESDGVDSDLCWSCLFFFFPWILLSTAALEKTELLGFELYEWTGV